MLKQRHGPAAEHFGRKKKFQAMICNCGGVTSEQRSRSPGEAVLTWAECRACGRVEPVHQKAGGVITAAGWAAWGEGEFLDTLG